jgi:acyl carrier protein
MSTTTTDLSGEGRLQRTLASVLGIDALGISDELSSESMASWDSLNHLNLVMALEQEFGIALSADEALAMRSVGRIRAVLAGHGIDC